MPIFTPSPGLWSPETLAFPVQPPTVTPQPGRFFQVEQRPAQWGPPWDPEVVAEYAYPGEGPTEIGWVVGAQRIQSHPLNAGLRLRTPKLGAESLFFANGIIDYGAPYQQVFIPTTAWHPYTEPEPCVPSGAGWLCP